MKLLLHVCMVRARRPPPPPRSGWGYARNGASRPFGGRKLGFPGFLDMPSTTSAPPQRSTQCLKNTRLQFPKVQYTAQYSTLDLDDNENVFLEGAWWADVGLGRAAAGGEAAPLHLPRRSCA